MPRGQEEVQVRVKPWNIFFLSKVSVRSLRFDVNEQFRYAKNTQVYLKSVLKVTIFYLKFLIFLNKFSHFKGRFTLCVKLWSYERILSLF